MVQNKLPRESRPSIKASRVETMELWICSCLLERTGASPSISSKKIMAGCIAFACSNSKRSCLSASPTHLLKQSAPLRIKNATLRDSFTRPINTGMCIERSKDIPKSKLGLMHEQEESFQYREDHKITHLLEEKDQTCKKSRGRAAGEESFLSKNPHLELTLTTSKIIITMEILTMSESTD